MNPSIDDFSDESRFALLQEVPYTDMRSFVLRHIANKSLVIKAYSIFQLLSIIVPFAFLGYELVRIFLNQSSYTGLLWILAGIAFSFTFLILLHELIHMLAFRILGKSDLQIGGEIRKFLFYVEADKQVLNKREYLFIAILPFLIILVLGSICTLIFSNTPLLYFFASITSIHSLFCAGDIAIISYMYKDEKEMFTYDDAETKTTFFYQER